MDKYGYVLKQNPEKDRAYIRYHKSDLMLMTTFQLLEICRQEKIIQGVINRMDREELIHVILRYRGAEEYFLIREPDVGKMDHMGAVFSSMQLQERQDLRMQCGARIVVYDGLAVNFYDGLTLPYDERLAGTNAFVVGGDSTICAILNIVPQGSRRDCLYLAMEPGMPCRESGVNNYSLYCMARRESELFYRIYHGESVPIPAQTNVWRIPLLEFMVKKPLRLSMPIAMDFGTSNTTADVYLDSQYFEQAGLRDGEYGLRENDHNYALFYDSTSDWQETVLLPSVVGVQDLEDGVPRFLFGYDALRLADASYIDEGFCVFHDIKRWVGDHEKTEEMTDRQGRRLSMPRKEILKAYLHHVIGAVQNRFKCAPGDIHISCPVKQRRQFGQLFAEILPEYVLSREETIDEGVSVLYNTISETVRKKTGADGEEYRALIIDCGGGTTDLCSCRFRLWDRRVSYKVEIDTAYEDGNTDFGGNNLTYRILQYLKVALVNRLYPGVLKPEKEILGAYDMDVFRYVDACGTAQLYQELEEEYGKAETFLPTRFREFESRSRADYFRVKNNYYFLFRLAETIKKEFYSGDKPLRIVLSSEAVEEGATLRIPVDKWKLSVRAAGGFETVKEFPAVYISIYELELLLKADIYGIIRRFMERLYEDGGLDAYSVIKLTGQSCRIGIFRDALKEFVPGRVIRFGQRSREMTGDTELKMACVDGALSYLKDRRYGYADIAIRTREPALPYRITAFTHHGEEVVLIDRLERTVTCGMISRNMEDLTLKLYLKDMDGKERYQYTCHTSRADFVERDYREILALYGEHIRQRDTDDILENEARFFIWPEPEAWAFAVLAVYRKDNFLYMGKKETFQFENEGWVRNFFDGES